MQFIKSVALVRPRELVLRYGKLASCKPSGFFSTATTQAQIPNILSSLEDPPTAKLAPPGNCQFHEGFLSAKLVARQAVSSTSSILRFALPKEDRPLNLSTCACVLAGASIDGEQVIRPYTPISTNILVGHVDFLIKDYGDGGTMSRYLHEIDVGSTDISFKHIAPNVKIQAPFEQTHIIMIAGGTGITPMLQALHAILGAPTASDQKVTLLYGSQTSQDILGRSLLEGWAQDYSDRFEVIHVLAEEPNESLWTGKRGFIDSAMLDQYLPDSNEDVLVLVCGPPPLYNAICGPREESDTISGILGEKGFNGKNVYKF